MKICLLSISLRGGFFYHKDTLLKVCQIGGKRLTLLTKSTTYAVNESQSDISTCSGIDVWRDEHSIHPPFFSVVSQGVVSHCQEAILVFLYSESW